jgi:hypothetical protein
MLGLLLEYYINVQRELASYNNIFVDPHFGLFMSISVGLADAQPT